jgi:hypothetical protein
MAIAAARQAALRTSPAIDGRDFISSLTFER